MDKITKLKVKYDLGVDEHGKKQSRTVMLNNVNEAVSNDTLKTLGDKVSTLVDGTKEEVRKVSEEVIK